MLRLPYGKSICELDETTLPGARVILPKTRALIPDPAALLALSVDRDEYGPSLIQSASGSDRAVILVPDPSRGRHFAKLIPVILDALNRAGIQDADIHLIIARGTHGTQSDEQHLAILGEGALRCAWSLHDADDKKKLSAVGCTPAGTKLRVNHLVPGAFVVGLGIVKHHYYAGYSGGRKIVMPGISARSSIRHNHSLSFMKNRDERHPEATHAILEGNPVSEDMAACQALCPVDYSVQLVLGAGRLPVALFSGEARRVFDEARQLAEELFLSNLAEKVDYAVAGCGGYPGDLNFLQAHKAIHHAQSFVRPGGLLVILARCNEGMGWDRILHWAEKRKEVCIIRELKSAYELPGQTALAMLQKASKLRILIKTELPTDTIRKLGMGPIESLEEGLSQIPASAKSGVILPHADLTVNRA